MRDTPSVTALGVALARAMLDRPSAPGGDADADRRLARDLMRDMPARPRRSEAARSDFLRAFVVRTRFFDDTVSRALDGGVGQIVILGAGYDTRALRFRTEGVRFFEVDHPATQRDKRARLAAIDARADDVTFVEADFTEPGLDDRLRSAGYDASARALFMCEGVFRYLPEEWFRELLRVTAAVAADGTELAASISTSDAPVHDARLEAIGEPVLTVPTRVVAVQWIVDAGWTVDDVGDMADAAAGTRRGRLLVRAHRAHDTGR